MNMQPFYDPQKTYEDNFKEGPYGAFADHTVFHSLGKPTQSFMGQAVFLPFGIAAGPLLNGTFVKAALDKGFDIATYKTVRTTQYASHPWPNVLFVNTQGDLTLDKAHTSILAEDKQHDMKHISITNSFGVPSFNPDFWQSDMRAAALYAKKGQIVVGSFQGTPAPDGRVKTYIDDFRLGARLVKETGVKIIEVNLSCPNEGSDRMLCFDIKRAQTVVHAIKNVIGTTPLIIKIAYFASEDLFEQLVQAVGPMVQGISAVNTIQATIVKKDGKQALPGKGRDKSGVGGSAIKWAGLAMTKRLKNLRDSFHLTYAIIGVGGVVSPLEYNEYRAHGADAVMSATGSMWNPYLAIEMKKSFGHIF